MNHVFSLVLLALLGAADGGAAPTPAPGKERTGVPIPDWTQGMPPPHTSEYALELQRRIESGKTMRVRAVVKAFLPIALSSFDLSGGGFHVAGTRVIVASPRKYGGLVLLVHHDQAPAEGSCWRVPGCSMEFDLHERMLEARLAGMDTMFLYAASLKNTVLDQPVSRKRNEHRVETKVGR